MPADAPTLYAEDLTLGRVFDLGSWEMTAPDIVAFATAWDPLPFHMDEEAANASAFKGLVASGMHTMSVAIRLGVDGVVSRTAIIAGRGVEFMRLHHPVRPGDTLRGTLEIKTQRMRDDGRGVIAWEIMLVNDDDTKVLTLGIELLVARRPEE